LKADNTVYIKERWEREANIVLPGQDWGEINKYNWKTTNSSFWREYGWKNTVRYFATPVQKKNSGKLNVGDLVVKLEQITSISLGLLSYNSILDTIKSGT